MRTLGVWVLASTLIAALQERFEKGELRGFSRAPGEHIVERLGDPLTVRRLEGAVHSKALGRPLAGVLVEIRGPAAAERIRSPRMDDRGRFRSGRLPEGVYAIKLTPAGFRSAPGALAIRRSARAGGPLRVEMLHRV